MAHMNVSLSEGLLAELKALVPARRRSAFIAEAVKEKLTVLKQASAVKETAATWDNVDRRDPEEEIRELRRGWDPKKKRQAR